MYRILIVEDDASMAKAMKTQIDSWGNQAETVKDFQNVNCEQIEKVVLFSASNEAERNIVLFIIITSIALNVFDKLIDTFNCFFYLAFASRDSLPRHRQTRFFHSSSTSINS